MRTSVRGIIAASLLTGSMLVPAAAFAQDASTPAPIPQPAQQTAPTPPTAETTATPTSPFTITGSAAIVSSYKFRGIAQSDNKPVVQGSFTVAHASGFYLATWGSSASSSSTTPINIGGTEIDVYGGFTHALGASGFTFDGGVYGYIYPGSKKAVGFSESYYELYASLTKTYGPVTAKAGVNFAPKQHIFRYNFSSPTHHNVYLYGELGGSVAGFAIHTHLGHTAGGFDFGKKYFDYTAGVTYKWKALAFDISVVGTDLSKKDIFNGFDCATDEDSTSGAVCAGGFTQHQYYRVGKAIPVGSITASF